MVWDLRGALLKKQEVETARLADFAFRQRVRAMRLLADELGVDPQPLVALVASEQSAALAEVAARHGFSEAEVARCFTRCDTLARQQLLAECGDPAPHRLA